MMYPFMTLDNDTEVVHSELQADGRVKVYFETPDEKDGFHHAVCWLPEYKWEDISGYLESELNRYKKFVVDNAHLIMEFASEGRFLNASNIPDKKLSLKIRVI